MALNLDPIGVIVYDLDGTVYSDTAQFDLYARAIQPHLPPESQHPYWTEYAAVLNGQHPVVRVGTYYDVERDLILEPRAGRIERALHWDGSEVPSLVRTSLYPDCVDPDQTRLINVGDLWWVPVVISFHYGGDRRAHEEAFLHVRTLMSQPSFVMRPIDGLQEAITGLRGRVVQVLATNSLQPDSEAILGKIGLLGLFDQMSFDTKKPSGLTRLCTDLATQYGIPFQSIVSVGDNLVNDVAPAAALGCQTVFIDPHGTAGPTDADLIVPAMPALLPLIAELHHKPTQPA